MYNLSTDRLSNVLIIRSRYWKSLQQNKKSEIREKNLATVSLFNNDMFKCTAVSMVRPVREPELCARSSFNKSITRIDTPATCKYTSVSTADKYEQQWFRIMKSIIQAFKIIFTSELITRAVMN